MNKALLLQSLNADIISKFRTAIEIGRWENGERLTEEQRQTCLQAVMIWEHEHLPPNERIGYIQKPTDDTGNIIGDKCDVEHEHHYPNLPNPTGDIGAINFKH